MIKRTTITLIAAVLLAAMCLLPLIAFSQTTPVGVIYGSSIACDPNNAGCVAIPMVTTVLCSVNCTRLSAPSFTDPNRFWGNDITNCRTSTDGGTTWANCASNPDATALYHYAGAADGSVIAIGSSGGNCLIRRSTNNATSWTTVFSSTFGGLQNCGDGGVSGGTRLKCASNGKCEFIFRDLGNTAQTIESTDNGATWTATALTNIISTPVSLAFNGSVGFASPVTGNGVNNNKAFVYNGSWSLSALWPSLVRCYPSIILSGGGVTACQTGGTGVSYTLNNTIGTVLNTFTLPGASTVASPGMIGISAVSSALWLITNDNNSGGAGVGVWVTRSPLSDPSLSKIFSGPANNGVNNQSDIFYANGCIYFSTGATTPMFAKIC